MMFLLNKFPKQEMFDGYSWWSSYNSTRSFNFFQKEQVLFLKKLIKTNYEIKNMSFIDKVFYDKKISIKHLADVLNSCFYFLNQVEVFLKNISFYSKEYSIFCENQYSDFETKNKVEVVSKSLILCKIILEHYGYELNLVDFDYNENKFKLALTLKDLKEETLPFHTLTIKIINSIIEKYSQYLDFSSFKKLSFLKQQFDFIQLRNDLIEKEKKDIFDFKIITLKEFMKGYIYKNKSSVSSILKLKFSFSFDDFFVFLFEDQKLKQHFFKYKEDKYFTNKLFNLLVNELRMNFKIKIISTDKSNLKFEYKFI